MKVKGMIAATCVAMALSMSAYADYQSDLKSEGLDAERQATATTKTQEFRVKRDSAVNTCINKGSAWVVEKGCKKLSKSDRASLRKAYLAAKKSCKDANGTWIKVDGCHFRQ